MHYDLAAASVTLLYVSLAIKMNLIEAIRRKKLLVSAWIVRCVVRPLLQQTGSGYLSSVGLENIDLQIAHLLPCKRNGFFIEAGANDGISQSNTYYLEKVLGWRGILVEPICEKAKLCEKNRRQSITINGALVRTGGPSHVTVEYANLMSMVRDGVIPDDVVDRHIETGRAVQCISSPRTSEVAKGFALQQILDQHAVDHVDFLSLDVEGYELQSLLGIDFSRTRIDAIFVETRPNNEKAIDELLSKVGYTWERIWVSRSCSNYLYLFREKTQSP